MSDRSSERKRILILGGGFAGVYTALHLDRLKSQSPELDVTLVSRDNYFLTTPLLFEAGSGVLEPRHVVNPIRPLLHRARFIEAQVKQIDVERKVVSICPSNADEIEELGFDHLVLALGGVTNTSLVPGADQGLTFKTLGDAIFLRNHIIRLFEWADVEKDAHKKKAQLTFVIVGGGLVSVELMGEMTTFVKNVARLYKNVDAREIRFEMIESGPRIAAEFDDGLADYAATVLKRRGVNIQTNTRVKSIGKEEVELPDGRKIESRTIVVATGVIPSPLIAELPLAKDHKGRVKTDATMRAEGRNDIWALGDCAAIPDPTGKPYPALAQHALREARQMAKNIDAVIHGQTPGPFIYSSKGTLAALGEFKGIARIYKFKFHGFPAWWIWRTYYLFQLPQWRRRLRVVIDWTVALFFTNDVVQLDLSHGNRTQPQPAQK